jgi:hypothetical protein
MENGIVKATSLVEVARVELDMQIATAKAYPRDEVKVVQKIKRLATLDKETAESCFYSLPRKEKQDDGTYKTKAITGESIRFAEIMMSCWGNIRVSAPVVEYGNDSITVTVMVADLETNTALPGSCTRKFYRFEGSKELSIANATSTAIRNAILRIIPKGLFKSTLDEIKKASLAKIEDTKEKAEKAFKMQVDKAFKYWNEKGIDNDKIFKILEIDGIEFVTDDSLVTLRGFVTAIKDGQTTIDEIFNNDKMLLNTDAENITAIKR